MPLVVRLSQLNTGKSDRDAKRASALHPIRLLRSKAHERTDQHDVRPLVLQKPFARRDRSGSPSRRALPGCAASWTPPRQAPAARLPKSPSTIFVPQLGQRAGQVPAALASQRLRERPERAVSKLRRLEERAVEIVAAIDECPEVGRGILPFVLPRLRTRPARHSRMRLNRFGKRPVVGSPRRRDDDVVPIIGQRQHDAVEVPEDVRSRELK